MRALNIICGIVCIIAALICFIHPIGAQLAYGYLTAIAIGCLGIILIVNYIRNRKMLKVAGMEAATGVAGLILGILGVIFMIMNVKIPGFVYATQEFCAVILMIFLLIEGIGALMVGLRMQGSLKPLIVIFGIAMIALCIFGIIFPAFVISTLGIFLGVGFAVNGINRILMSI